MVAQRDPAKGLAFYFKDHLGSTRNIQTTAARMRVNYYPFGEQHTVTGDETNHLFTGKELDNTTDLYYFGARYYDPSIGRFISVDPHADSYPSLTPYHYCGNNPLRFLDPTGMDTVEVGYVSVGAGAQHTLLILTQNGQQSTIVEGMPTSREKGAVSGSSQSSASGSVSGSSGSSTSGSISGAASSASSGGAGWGNLEANIVNQPSDISPEKREVVPTPEGMTEEQFTQELIGGFATYDNSVLYAPLPTGSRGNSNSMVGSVVRSAGSNFKPKKWSPGWNKNVLPHQRKKQ